MIKNPTKSEHFLKNYVELLSTAAGISLIWVTFDTKFGSRVFARWINTNGLQISLRSFPCRDGNFRTDSRQKSSPRLARHQIWIPNWSVSERARTASTYTPPRRRRQTCCCCCCHHLFTQTKAITDKDLIKVKPQHSFTQQNAKWISDLCTGRWTLTAGELCKYQFKVIISN